MNDSASAMGLRARVKRVIESDQRPGGRAFQAFIHILIVLALLAFAVGTLPDLSPGANEALGIFELVVVAIFTAEYLLRVWVADRPLRFVFSFYGLVDLLAILPFYLAIGVDLRSLRVVRLSRLLRVAKLARYSRAMDRIRRAVVLAKEELVLFFFMATIVLFFAAVGIYYFENPVQPEKFSSVFDGLWWAIATFTTVGYGDIYPITTGGRIFTAFVLMIGLGVVAVPTGLLTSALIKARREEEQGEDAGAGS